MERRNFFRYIGAATAAAALNHSGYFRLQNQPARQRASGRAAQFEELQTATPGPGEKVASTFVLQDDLKVPKGHGYDILARWGDRWGDVEFGTNADFTAILPIPKSPGRYWLFVNHEYISLLPWLQGFEAAKGRKLPKVLVKKRSWQLGEQELKDRLFDLEALRERARSDAENLSQAERQQLANALLLCQEALDDLGVSILEIEALKGGRFRIVADGQHRRITGQRSQNIATEHLPRFTGPAANWLGKPLGTLSNCSGGVAPWGSFFSCEENYQDYVDADFGATGIDLQHRNKFGIESRHDRLSLPRWIRGIGQGALQGKLDGRHYGWVCEVNPQTGQMKKHLSLGRFRHENVALAVKKGQPLAAYMGDDRRGGHIWKYLSRQVVMDPSSASCSELLTDGQLHVAQFKPDHQGSWIPLSTETKLVRPHPASCAGSTILVPARSPLRDLKIGGAKKLRTEQDVDAWIGDIEGFARKKFSEMTLGDLVRPPELPDQKPADMKQLLILMDAYLMANCIGGTATARPEDLECEFSEKSSLNVFVAFTDFSPDESGGPQVDIFPDSVADTSRRYGGIHHIAEALGKTSALTFSWGQVLTSGEAHRGGGGFAAADNLAIDPDGELWFLTDMSAANNAVEDRKKVKEGSRSFMGIFGNNAVWHWDRQEGRPRCFAQSPMESELTGPTFFRNEEGETSLILSVQHPGEINGRHEEGQVETRHYEIADHAGKVMKQIRSVPLGSNFAAREDAVPRSAVCVIYRKKS